jgi:hypothetical protein
MWRRIDRSYATHHVKEAAMKALALLTLTVR